MGRPDKRKAARDSQFVGKKKESHGINLSRGQWVLKLLRSDKGFYNQANWIEEYEYDKGLYYNNYGDDFDEESGESDSDFDPEKDSDSDCESDRNSKKDIASERNVVVSINTLQSLITSATRCKACHEPVRIVEDRKKAVGLACLLKIKYICLTFK